MLKNHEISKVANIIHNYDFDQGKNPCMSFTRRFARENNNDNGEKLEKNEAEKAVR